MKHDPCHPLVLKVEDRKPSDGSDHYSEGIICKRCLTPITGPFYCCEKGDNYYLHKVCAELPNEMKHPLHPQHTLQLSSPASKNYICDICSEECIGFVYHCGEPHTCKFVVDLICASASVTIEDKCHFHPLTPIQLSSPFYCHICRTKEKGVSYKCGICPFWAHQNCTLLPTNVKHSDHEHSVTLSHSIPIKYHSTFNHVCDICHNKMRKFETVYSCVGCLFFAHANCATSSENKPSRDEDKRVEDDGEHDLQFLPVRKDWTSLISSLVGKSKRAEGIIASEIYHFSHNHLLHLQNQGEGNLCEACGQPITGLSYLCAPCNFYLHTFCTELPDQYNNLIDNRTRHFSHDHPLYLLDEQLYENVHGKLCDACSEPVSNPSYGCIKCDYFLHKCCIELPKEYPEPFQAEHKMELFVQFPNKLGIFACSYCARYSNGFGYSSSESVLDLKCASLSGPIKHEAHKHTLTKRIHVMASCSVCTSPRGKTSHVLQCESCNFSMCQYCAMLPAIINHRYCKHGLGLRYSPIKDYDRDYICDLCEQTLEPKFWFYHCGDCEQIAHPKCLINNAAHTNIKFGKRFSLPDHEHKLTLASFTHVKSYCNVCLNSLNYGYAVGFICATCNFKIHLNCVVKNRLSGKMLESEPVIL